MTTASKKTTKKTTKKTPADSQKRRPSEGGQSGAPLELAPRDLNPKERTVYDALSPKTPRPLSELADAFSRSNPKARRNSWVRNSLRRLVRSGLARRAEEPGHYVRGSGKKGN